MPVVLARTRRDVLAASVHAPTCRHRRVIDEPTHKKLHRQGYTVTGVTARTLWRPYASGVEESAIQSSIAAAHAVRPDVDAAAVKLAIFDLDGTLTARGTSVLQRLGEHFQFEQLANDLVERHDGGAMTNVDVSSTAATRLGGRHRDELVAALDKLCVRPEVADTVQALRGRGVHCAVATLTFDFAADHVARSNGFEVNRIMSTELEWTTDGRATGVVRKAMKPDDKVGFMRKQCGELGISVRNVMVIGDSRADVPAMKSAGLAVGLNAAPEVREVADVSLDSLGELMDAVEDRLPHVPHTMTFLPPGCR